MVNLVQAALTKEFPQEQVKKLQRQTKSLLKVLDRNPAAQLLGSFCQKFGDLAEY